MLEEALSFLYPALSLIVVGVISMLGKTATEYFKAKIKNSFARDASIRLCMSIQDAVTMVDATVKRKLLEAKKETSDGGKKITKKEGEELRIAVWDVLRAEYGGMSGIKKLLEVLGFIGNEVDVETKVVTMIEAEVERQKKLSNVLANREILI